MFPYRDTFLQLFTPFYNKLECFIAQHLIGNAKHFQEAPFVCYSILKLYICYSIFINSQSKVSLGCVRKTNTLAYFTNVKAGPPKMIYYDFWPRCSNLFSLSLMYQSFVSLATHFSPISEQQFFSKEVKA